MDSPRPPDLSERHKNTLLQFARQSLLNVWSETAPYLDENVLEPELRTKSPCFVTLTKNDRLRGCIGCIATLNTLARNVIEFSLRAAFKDPRFPPLQKHELSAVRIHIAVLGPLIPMITLDDITIGQHGLYVRQQSRSGLLLASVADQFRWSPIEFLEQTCLKAGLEPSLEEEYEKFYFEEFSFSEPQD